MNDAERADLAVLPGDHLEELHEGELCRSASDASHNAREPPKLVRLHRR